MLRGRRRLVEADSSAYGIHCRIEAHEYPRLAAEALHLLEVSRTNSRNA